ncbi:hypothetical protein NAHI_52 [Klebsiella phage vB_KpnP_NahiliMali]|uniref:Uncharacterized protein n=1 Tax=Klebsiella phage vB_KpnP_NahiliMali TaxID=2591373 RepID=A0A5B9NGM8_9CAUD|nr:hypothetical protein NAHI_52 [Klebsiella phage vB_KpnP_NahiliMali]
MLLIPILLQTTLTDILKEGVTMRKVLNITITILRHRVTYRFLAVVLGALGVAAATDNAGRVEAIVCAIIGDCT